MLRKLLGPCVALLSLMSAELCNAENKAPVRVGFDGEYGHRTSQSQIAIERGILTAMAEINAAGGVLGGRQLKLETRDNRSVPSRGIENVRDLASLPDLVAIFTGKFSPVVIECVPVAQELKVPLLAVWSAADEIVDNKYKPNFVFRLSLKDSWAVPVMLNQLRGMNVQSFGVLLPNTAWGRSNQKAIAGHVAKSQDLVVVGERWYNFGETSLLDRYQSLRNAGAKAIILVANELEGSALVRDIATLPKAERLPIVSHWGVTGGAFQELSGDRVKELDFYVVQTFTYDQGRGPVFEKAVATALRLFQLQKAEDIGASVGFAHAYDMMHLLARAIDKAGSTNREAIHKALESLGPMQGIVRNYDKPFTDQRHEALGPNDVFMAKYLAGETLVRVKASEKRGP